MACCQLRDDHSRAHLALIAHVLELEATLLGRRTEQRRPKDDRQVGRRHLVDALVAAHLVEVAHKVLERRVVGVREVVDLLVQSNVPQAVVVLLGGLDEPVVQAVCEQRLGQLAEPQL